MAGAGSSKVVSSALEKNVSFLLILDRAENIPEVAWGLLTGDIKVPQKLLASLVNQLK